MRNESAYIEACLRSILCQDYPQEKLEVIVLDGQSDDDSRLVVERTIAGRKNCRLVDNPKKIQSAAWNLGIQISRGEVISIVSGHSELSPDYVSKAVETLLRTRADMVGGTVRAVSAGIMGKTIALAMSTPFGVGNAEFRYTEKELETDTVFMGFCWRETYEKIDGFDEELVRNQDDEFSYRLRKDGGRIVCSPGIVSYYRNRANLHSLSHQYYQYGLWKVRVLQKHPRQMSLRQFIPPAFVFSLLLSALFGLSPVLRPLSCVVPLLYLSANLLASVHTASHRGWKYLLLLPVTFFALHLSYGLGFWAGWIKFWNRWGDKTGKTLPWPNEITG